MNKNVSGERVLQLLGEVDKKYIIEAEQSERTNKNKWMKWCATAACICLIFSAILTGNHLYKGYTTESCYISIDVNPSLEFCLNSKYKVIDVCAYNEDGQKVADSLDVKNKTYQEAVLELLENDVFQSYITEKSELTFTLVCENEKEIRKGLEECLAQCEIQRQICEADYTTRQEARENHCSIGKYAVYQDLAEYDKEVTLEECMEMNMHELHERLRKCQEDCKNFKEQQNSSENQCDTNGHKYHHGHTAK